MAIHVSATRHLAKAIGALAEERSDRALGGLAAELHTAAAQRRGKAHCREVVGRCVAALGDAEVPELDAALDAVQPASRGAAPKRKGRAKRKRTRPRTSSTTTAKAKTTPKPAPARPEVLVRVPLDALASLPAGWELHLVRSA